MKRIISLILVICLLGTSIPWAYAVEPAVPQSAKAQTDIPEVATPQEPEEELPPILYAVTSSGETADGFVYQVIDDASVTIVGYTGTAAALTVPGTIQGLPVTTIAAQAFYKCDILTSVVLPEGLTTLGYQAFGDCANLAAVTIPESFSTVTGQYNGDQRGPFYDCSKLSSVCFSGERTVLPDYLLAGSGLTEIDLPDSITQIGSYGFQNCRQLTAVTLPENLTTLQPNAFQNCSALTAIAIPDTLTAIGSKAFNGCSALKSITFSKEQNLTNIQAQAFYSCDSLISVVLPEGLTTLGYQAFGDCANLTAVTIPESFSTVTGQYNGDQRGPFYDCSKLSSVCFSGERTVLPDYLLEGSGLTEIDLPDSITQIGSYGFHNCRQLTAVTLPENLTTLQPDAFQNCSALTAVVFPDALTAIGSKAFNGCSALKSITFSKEQTLTNIQAQAFCNCDSLTSVVLPEGLTTLGYQAFGACANLTAVTIPESFSTVTGQYNGDQRGPFYDCIKLTSVCFSGERTVLPDYLLEGSGITEIDLPDSITQIGSYGFQNCRQLTAVTLPENLTTLQPNAFQNCSALTAVVFPDALTVIGSKAFDGCSTLKSITFSEEKNLTNIQAQAFYSCDSLISVVLPEGLTTLGYQAFGDCANLTAVTIPESFSTVTGQYNGDQRGPFYDCIKLSSVRFSGERTVLPDYLLEGSGLTEIDLPDSITQIGSYGFQNCRQLAAVTLPENLTTLQPNAFQNCSSLTAVVFPDALTVIGSKAFDGCSTLKSITFSKEKKLTNIQAQAFNNCDALTSVVLPEGLTTLGYQAFGDCANLTAVTIPESFSTVSGQSNGEQRGPFYDCVKLSSVRFSGERTVLPDYLLEGSGLTEIYLPDTITEIGNYAFRNCNNLTEVKLPTTLKNVGQKAFSNCTALETLAFASKNFNISSNALENCGSPTILGYSQSTAAVESIKNGYDFRPLADDNAVDRVYLDFQCTEYFMDTNSAIIGNTLTMAVNYSFLEPSVVTDAELEIWIPEGTKIMANAIELNGHTIQDVDVSTNPIMLNVPVEKGQLRFCLQLTPGADQEIVTYAVMNLKEGGQKCREVIQVLSESIPEVTLSAADRTDSATIAVSGIATAGASVALAVDGKLQKTVTANKAGSYSAELTLAAAPEDFRSYQVTAQVNDTVAEKKVTYLSKVPELTEFMMYYRTHGYAELDLLAYQGKSPSLPINPSHDITLTAAFTQQDLIDKVWFVTTRNNRVRTVEAEFDGTHYVAVLKEGVHFNGTPGTVSVEYSLKSAPVSLKTNASHLEDADQAAKDLKLEDLVTSYETYTEPTDKMPEGLTLTDGKKATVDLAPLTGSATPQPMNLTIETYKYTDEKVSNFLNPEIPAASLLMSPLIGVTTVYRSNSSPMSGSTASSSGGWLRFTVTDPDGSVYNVSYQSSQSSKVYEGFGEYVCMVENVSTNEVIRFLLESGINGDTEELFDGLDTTGDIFGMINTALEMNNIQNDYEATVKRIYQTVPPDQLDEALEAAKTVKQGRSDYVAGTYALGAITAYAGAAGLFAGPPGLVLAGLLAAITLSAKYCSEYSPDSIFGGSFSPRWILDPSGYVYEGDPTNRLEGVTTTAYWVPEPEGEDVTEEQLAAFYAEPPADTAYGTIWEAEAYDQSNPLTTDANGAYSWNVPSGWWRVKYEKEGYLTTWSEWLPVPPPQMDVNIPMIPSFPPALESVESTSNQITVTFNQCVDASTLKLSLTADSGPVAYTITPTEGLAKTVTLTPKEPLSKGSSVTVGLSHAEGTSGLTASSGSITTQVGSVKALVVDVPPEVEVGKSAVFSITLQNAQGGETLKVTSSTPKTLKIASAPKTLSKDGTADVVVTGNLAGQATITVEAGGLSETITLQVVKELTVPEIASAQVKNGTVAATVSSNCEATLVAAVYNGDQFVSAHMEAVSIGRDQAITISGLPDGTVKLFLMDAKWKPLCEVITVS